MFEKILKREKLLIVLAVLIAVVYLGGRYFDRRYDEAVAQNTVAQLALKEQRAENAAIEKRVVARLQQYQDLVSSLTTQNAALAQAAGQRRIELKHQQEIDQALPLPDLAIRWTHLAKLQPDDIKSTNKGLLVSESGSRTTVQVLETVPVLTQDLSDAHTVLNNKDKQIEGAEVLVSELQTQVSGLKGELTAKDRACDARLILEKSKAHKSKVTWFVTGIGIGAGVVLKLVLF